MASDRELKQRIRSVQSIGQITNAMKMVASSQIRKVESQAVEGRPYADKLRQVLSELSQQIQDAKHPLLERREVKNIGLIVVGADNGLCGGYNSGLNKMALKTIESMPFRPSKIVCLGSKAVRGLVRGGYEPTKTYLKWEAGHDLAAQLSEMITKWFLDGEVDEVWGVYTKAVTTLVCEPVKQLLLPMSSVGIQEASKDKKGEKDKVSSSKAGSKDSVSSRADYTFEPDCSSALEKVVPMYLRAIVSQMLFESKTSEFGSRLRAMTNATENADKLASELTLKYYRVRQNNITTEIIEISSGAEALNN
ncbi:MAG: ATP synthase F1 subunit gamma [Candidatus Bruticola sp.]